MMQLKNTGSTQKLFHKIESQDLQYTTCIDITEIVESSIKHHNPNATTLRHF
jgi:hypothetical protein